MTDLEYSMAATEVLEGLKNFKKEDVEKISPQFLEFLKSKKLDNYKAEFDFSKPITELELRGSSKAMLGMIYRTYWCNEEEKKEYDKLLRKNSIEHQKQLREKYNPDEIFKKSNMVNSEKESTQKNNQIIKRTEEKWYKKLKSIIIKFFRGEK